MVVFKMRLDRGWGHETIGGNVSPRRRTPVDPVCGNPFRAMAMQQMRKHRVWTKAGTVPLLKRREPPVGENQVV